MTSLKLKTVEYEINLLVYAYETTQNMYIQYIQSKQYGDASIALRELEEINSKLLSLSTQGIQLLAKDVSYGTQYQESVHENKSRLYSVLRKAKRESYKLTKLEKQLANIDGELVSSQSLYSSYYLQYIILSFVGLAVMVLTLKTVLMQEDSALDTIILVIVMGIFAYFIIKKYIIN